MVRLVTESDSKNKSCSHHRKSRLKALLVRPGAQGPQMASPHTVSTRTQPGYVRCQDSDFLCGLPSPAPGEQDMPLSSLSPRRTERSSKGQVRQGGTGSMLKSGPTPPLPGGPPGCSGDGRAGPGCQGCGQAAQPSPWLSSCLSSR